MGGGLQQFWLLYRGRGEATLAPIDDVSGLKEEGNVQVDLCNSLISIWWHGIPFSFSLECKPYVHLFVSLGGVSQLKHPIVIFNNR